MAQKRMNVPVLDEKELNSRSDNREESIEDIKVSLDRIEELLNKGHELLYGENKPAVSPAFDDHVDGSSGGKPPRPLDSSTNGHVIVRDSYNVSITPTKFGNASVGSTPQRGHSMSSKRRSRRSDSAANLPPEMLEMSASARAKYIEEVKNRGGSVPDMEEGVDDMDTAQDVSIQELKNRIHRELEEYRRNGPLMKRRKSKKPNAVATRDVPRNEPKQAVERPSRVGGAKAQGASTTPQKSRSAPPPAPGKKAPLPKRTAHSTQPRAAAATQQQQQQQQAEPARGGRVPVWERLYQQASVQRERNNRRREQQRMEEVARARPKTKGRRLSSSATLAASKHTSELEPLDASEPQAYRPLGAAKTSGAPQKVKSTAVHREHGEPPANATAPRPVHPIVSRSNQQPVQRAKPAPGALQQNGASRPAASRQQEAAKPTADPAQHKTVVPLPKKAAAHAPAPAAKLDNGHQEPKHNAKAKTTPPPQPQLEAPAPAPAPLPRAKEATYESPNKTNNLTVHARGYSLDSNELVANEDEDEDTPKQEVPGFVKPLDLRGLTK